MIVRQSTTRTIIVGPILDADGVAKTDEVVGSIKVTKNGTVGAINGSATLTHDHTGKYKLALTATDCDTVGGLEISLNSTTNAMPVKAMTVVEEAIYDQLFASGAVALPTAAAVAAIPTNPMLDTEDGSSFNAIPDMATATNQTTLLDRLTASRAAYLDNLNVGGAVASNADILALNQSASRRILLTTVGQYERPESGSTVYTIEARTFDGDGAAVNADSSPTLTGTGATTGSLAANIGTISNPATGVYRWDYTVTSGATVEPARFDVSATISSSAFTLSVYSQIVDFVSATWTSSDASKLTAIHDKLPSADYLLGSANADGSGYATPTNITAGTISTVTNLTNAPTSGDLTSAMKASVNAEVLDVLNTDTFAEPGQGAPGATISLAAKIGFLYKAWRNKITQTSTTYTLYADDTTTADQAATVSDDDTTFTKGEVGTGA